jgi:hypothetical protein
MAMASAEPQGHRLKDYALGLEIGVIQIPFYLLADPWHHGLATALPIVVLLFLVFGAVGGGLNPGHSWIMGLLVAAPLWILVGPAAVVMSTNEELLRLDLPLMTAALLSALAGSYAGKILGSRRGPPGRV